MSRLHRLRRISPSPATASRISDAAVKDPPSRSAAWRKHEIDRQASEIERLVKLAEQCTVERRQQAPVRSSTAAGPMREHTGDERLCRKTNRHQDVILLPVARTPAAASATATLSHSRHRRLWGRQSPLTLSQLLDVKSLERCPKCHKVRLDVSSSIQDVAAAQSHNSGGYSPRVVRLKTLVGDSATTTGANRRSRPRTTPVETTELVGVKTALSTNPTSNQSRSSATNTTTLNLREDQGQGQGQGRHVPTCSAADVVCLNGEVEQDTNNNYDCESSNTTTWQLKADDGKLTNVESLTSSGGDNGRPSSRPQLPVWRKRSSLLAVQQTWAEQSTTGDDKLEQNVDNRSPSAASSYDPLDTVNDTDRYNVLHLYATLCFNLAHVSADRLL